ncbi:Phospholipase A I [Chlorella vulgaris]
MFGLGSFSKRPDAWRLDLAFSHQQELEVNWTGADGEAAVLAALQDALDSPDLVHEHVGVQLTAASQQLQGVVAAASFGQSTTRLSLSVQATRSQLTGVELTRTVGSSALSTSIALALMNALDVATVTRLRFADGGAVAALADPRVLSRFTALRVLNLSHAGLGALPAAVGLLTQLQASSWAVKSCTGSWWVPFLPVQACMVIPQVTLTASRQQRDAAPQPCLAQELRVVGNQLRILPPEVGQLVQLRVLAADSNQLTILPGELRRCVVLEELTLQHNRLTSVLLSFASLRNLSVLHLYDNPLEFLPEISPCNRLHHLTVANLRVTADPAYTKFKVEVLPPPPGAAGSGIAISLWDSKQSDKLRPIFSLMLRRSSGHHPLLAGALRYLAEEDPKNRELMAKQENGLQQLVLMALSDSPVVVEETCHTLTLLAEHSPSLADAVVENDANAIMRLLPSVDEQRQLSTLRLLAGIAYSSPAAAAKLATEGLLRSLEELVEGWGQEEEGDGAPGGADGGGAAGGCREEVRTSALKALGNLAFCADNQRKLERNSGLMRRLSQLALGGQGAPVKVQAAALRVLAILGENELVRQAVGKTPIQGRGLRILSLDGGGMKGLATVRLLAELERHTGKRIHEMFDLIVGTSTGGLLAVALGLRHMSTSDCNYIYKVLGQKVFSRIVAAKDNKEESWMESFYRTFQNKTSHVRAVVVGYKHDASVYEALLREYCDFSQQERCIGDAMIDTAGLHVPAVALVSTLSSITPAPPFVFRNYQLPPGSAALAASISAHGGSCKHPVWQAVRASSAASFYMEDFSCGGDKFQDGAVVANNPTLVAMQEARLLWPEHSVDAVISLGVGLAPPSRREKGMTSFMDTGAILIESSTSVSRVEEAAATLLPLVPGVKYFRFCATDPRCAMELDEIDPLRWAALEAATDEYIALPATQAKFAEAAAALGLTQQVKREGGNAGKCGCLEGEELVKWQHLAGGSAAGLGESTRPAILHASADALRSVPPLAQVDGTGGAPSAAAAAPSTSLKLGSRRKLVVLRAPRLAGHQAGLDDAVAASLARLPGCAAAVNLQRLSVPSQTAPDNQQQQQKQEQQEQPHKQQEEAQAQQRQATVSVPAAAARIAAGPTTAGQRQHSRAAAVAVPSTASEDGAAHEGGGLSGYLNLSSWFGSPAKHPTLSTIPDMAAGAAAATAAAAAAGVAPRVGRTPSRQDGGTHGTNASVSPATSPLRHVLATPAAPVCVAASGQPADGSAPASSAAGLDLLALLEGKLEPLLPAMGVLHLGMEVPGGQGPVLHWKQRLQVVAEPSEEASELLQSLGHDPVTARLTDVFAAQPELELEGGRTLSAVSSQTQWSEGAPLSMLLLSASSPEVTLPADGLGALAWLLRGQLVVCTAPLPPGFAAALLRAGAKGVICRTEKAGDSGSGSSSSFKALELGAEGCCAFFSAFYEALLAGQRVAAALQTAEEQQPALRVAGFGANQGKAKMDSVDQRQQTDIERLIAHCQELEDRVEEMEASILQADERSRDRAVALRTLLRDDKQMDQFLAQDDGLLELPPEEGMKPWDVFRHSFTLALSKGYLRTTDTLRNKLMVSEWELGRRPIALQIGVSRFEAFCAANRVELDFDAISEIYSDPSDLRPITDPYLRMQARAIITQAEFLSKIIPDNGIIDALARFVSPGRTMMALHVHAAPSPCRMFGTPGRRIHHKSAAVVRPPRAFSALSFAGIDTAEQERSKGADAAADKAPDHANSNSGQQQREPEPSRDSKLADEVTELHDRLDQLTAQVQQLNDRARERAISLAQALRAAGGGDLEPIEQVQLQQDDQLEHDQKATDQVMDGFTQLMSKGYIQSAEKIRDRLLISEGVGQFEKYCAEEKVSELSFEMLTQLYQDPDRLTELIKDEHLRMHARACINAAVDADYQEAWNTCTEESRKLAQQYSQSEVISKVAGSDSVLGSIKKLAKTAFNTQEPTDTIVDAPGLPELQSVQASVDDAAAAAAAAGPAEVLDGNGAAAPPDVSDPTIVATHSYLGHCDDLVGTSGLLEEGRVYRLPVLPLDGLVLCPGATLPLRLAFRGDRALLQQALMAPAPLTRLIAVVCCHRSYSTPQLQLQRVGCVAEIRKVGGGGINLLAKGRQRVEVQLEATAEGSLQLSSVPVKVLPEPGPLAVPLEARAGVAWHPPGIYALYDSWRLAKRARRLFHSIAPQAREFEGNPLELSYFLLSNLPVNDNVRQQLLEASTVDDRLRAECRMLQTLGVLCCRACRTFLARSTDAIQMSEEGISACFVNSHSWVHDIVTLSTAGGDRDPVPSAGAGLYAHSGSSSEDGNGGWTSSEEEDSEGAS